MDIFKQISTGMSNIYLKVTIEKKCRTQNFDFWNIKVSFWGALTHADIIEFSNLKIGGLEAKLCMAFLEF